MYKTIYVFSFFLSSQPTLVFILVSYRSQQVEQPRNPSQKSRKRENAIRRKKSRGLPEPAKKCYPLSRHSQISSPERLACPFITKYFSLPTNVLWYRILPKIRILKKKKGDLIINHNSSKREVKRSRNNPQPIHHTQKLICRFSKIWNMVCSQPRYPLQYLAIPTLVSSPAYQIWPLAS